MPRLLIIGYVWPEPTSSAAGSRMMQLIRFFLKEGYSVCFATTAQETPFMADLQSLGVVLKAIALNDESFDFFVRELQPEVVLFDRFMMEEQFGWRVSEQCPGALKLLDTEDLHFLRKARQEAVKKQLPLDSHLLQSDLAKREIASIYRCDLSLMISETEIKILREQFQVPESLLFYLPLTEEKTCLSSYELPSFEARKHFVSLGNFLHEPNWDAVQLLKQHIWPIIKKALPEAELHIYGAYPTQKVFQLHAPANGFLIKGRADAAEEVLLHSRLLLAPLRFGAGIKGKFLDAMRMGTPSITTGIGTEGIAEEEISWGGLVEDDLNAFAQAAVRLYQDKELWEQAQARGFTILEAKFPEEKFREGFLIKISQLRQHLQQHREANFMGSLLSHHQFTSTKYLSKYIEMKNRLLKYEE